MYPRSIVSIFFISLVAMFFISFVAAPPKMQMSAKSIDQVKKSSLASEQVEARNSFQMPTWSHFPAVKN